MEVFEAKAKKWGNSLGFIIPKDIVKEEELVEGSVFTVLVLEKTKPLGRKIWGTANFDRPTQEIIDEADQNFNK